MPQPDLRAKMIAGPLPNVSVAYRNQEYVADRVFPIIDKVAPEAKIAKYMKGAWFRDEAGIRGPGSRARRGGYPTSWEDISLKEYAFASEVTDEDRKAAESQGAPPMDPDQDAVEFASDKIDLKKERVVASLVFGTTWSGVSGGEDADGLWAAGEGNTFLSDLEARIETIRGNTGFKPNKLLISANILSQIKQEATVLDRIKYTQTGVVTADLIAAMLELDEVLVAGSIHSTAKEKKSGLDFTAQSIWEKNQGKGSAFLFYAPSKPGLKIPSAGYQARGGQENDTPRKLIQWREEAEHQDVYECSENTDIVVTGPDLGFLWVDCIAT